MTPEREREAQAEPLQDEVRVLPTLLHLLPWMEMNLEDLEHAPSLSVG